METQELLVDPLALVGGCGCPDCCSRPIDNSLQDASYNSQSYDQFSLTNFAAAVTGAPQTVATTPLDPETADSSTGTSLFVDPTVTGAAVLANSAIAFSDVSRQAGLELVTQTWGSAWADYDGDGLVDLWLNRHQLTPILYRNQGDGTFAEVTDAVFGDGATRGDFHGAAFVDIENDGDLDLIQLAGGDQGAEDTNPNKEKKLYINENGQLINQSAALGVDYLIGRGRVPVPFDINNDGLLDYVFTGPARNDGTAPPTLFLQNPDGTFDNVGDDVQLDIDVPSGTFAMVSDLTGDGKLELIYAALASRLTIYDTTDYEATLNSPLQDITNQILPPLGNLNIQDVAIGDFNGDGRQDLFIARQGSVSSGVRFDGDDITQSQSGRTRLVITKAMQRGIEVITSGTASFNFEGDPSIDLPEFMKSVGIQPTQIKIGAAGFSPETLNFQLDAVDANGVELGIPDYIPGVNEGIFIGYEAGRWSVMLSGRSYREAHFLYEFTDPIQDVLAVNFNPYPVRNPNSLLINTENGFVDQSQEWGLDDLDVSASNVVSGDFDNDGDLDLYIVATDITQNQKNVLLENQGNGTFVTVENAGGAEGTNLGIGDGVGVADYDNDGDLDLFVTNGDVAGFKRPFYIDGSNQLFRNDLNNGNHWVLIDLEGVTSNRDAIGARVEVTAGGVTQVREQNGGIHNRSQNDQRLHFGLGQNATIEKVEILWPSGLREEITNLAVDQIFKIVEGSGDAVTVGGGNGGGGTPEEPPMIGNKMLFEGTSAGDILNGTAGMDIMRGKGGADTLFGLAGNDNLFGDAGNDSLNGGAGNDLLIGNRGQDVLTGGVGRDKFLFNSKNDGDDLITDFVSGEDTIRLRSSNFGGGLVAGRLDASQFHTIGVSAIQNSHRLIYDSGTGQLFFDEDGAGSSAAVLLVTLQGSPSLTASDIRLV